MAAHAHLKMSLQKAKSNIISWHFLENSRKLSFNYHPVLSLSVYWLPSESRYLSNSSLSSSSCSSLHGPALTPLKDHKNTNEPRPDRTCYAIYKQQRCRSACIIYYAIYKQQRCRSACITYYAIYKQQRCRSACITCYAIYEQQRCRSACITYYAIYEQQRCRSACASAQSNQHLCYSLPR